MGFTVWDFGVCWCVGGLGIRPRFEDFQARGFGSCIQTRSF